MLNNWMNYVKRVREEEDGITALETAIILIAFVVVASVFAFTMLSAGTFSTERGKEAIYAGLSEVQSSMDVKGSVIAEATASTEGMSGTVNSLIFTVSNALGGEPINLGADSDVVFEYRDAEQRIVFEPGDWEIGWLGTHNGNGLLETGELAEITIKLDEAGLDPALGPNTTFVLEIKPPRGAVLNLQRTTPAWLDAVNDLR